MLHKKMKTRFNSHDFTIRDPYKQQDQSDSIISRPILSGETVPLRVNYGSYCKHCKHVLCRMVVYGAKFMNQSNFYLTNLLTLYQRARTEARLQPPYFRWGDFASYGGKRLGRVCNPTYIRCIGRYCQPPGGRGWRRGCQPL
jgi:hypothetical protein